MDKSVEIWATGVIVLVLAGALSAAWSETAALKFLLATCLWVSPGSHHRDVGSSILR